MIKNRNNKGFVPVLAMIATVVVTGGTILLGSAVIDNVHQQGCGSSLNAWRNGDIYGDLADANNDEALDAALKCQKSVHDAVRTAKPVATMMSSSGNLGGGSFGGSGSLSVAADGLAPIVVDRMMDLTDNLSNPSHKNPVRDAILPPDIVKRIDEVNKEEPVPSEPVGIPSTPDPQPPVPPVTTTDTEPEDGSDETGQKMESTMINGEIIDSIEGNGVNGASIQVTKGFAGFDDELLGSFKTNSSGEFSINVDSASNVYSLTISAEGFDDFTTQLVVRDGIVYMDDGTSPFNGVIKLSGGIAEEAEEDVSYVGTYTASINTSTSSSITEQGITVTTTYNNTGSITLNVLEDHSASCTLNLDTNFTTNLGAGGMAIGSSSNCSGNLDPEGGVYVVSGTLSGSVIIDGQSIGNSGPFNISGFIEDGELAGTISIPDNPEIEFGY